MTGKFRIPILTGIYRTENSFSSQNRIGPREFRAGSFPEPKQVKKIRHWELYAAMPDFLSEWLIVK